MIAKRYMSTLLVFFALICLAGAQELRHVSNEEARSHLAKQVEPVYPKMAQIAHIQGAVNLEITITEDGSVTGLRAVSGHPILLQSAMDAVQQWKFQPFMEAGKPAPVRAAIKVYFGLEPGSELRSDYLEKEDECSQNLVQDKLDAAEPVCRHAIELANKLPQNFAADKGRAYGYAGMVAYRQGKLHEAVEDFQKQLSFAEQSQQSGSPVSGQVHTNLARAYEATGSLQDANEQYAAAEKAQEIALNELERQQAKLKPGAFQGVKASYLHNTQLILEDHARLLRKMGKTGEAEVLEQKAAALKENK